MTVKRPKNSPPQTEASELKRAIRGLNDAMQAVKRGEHTTSNNDAKIYGSMLVLDTNSTSKK